MFASSLGSSRTRPPKYRSPSADFSNSNKTNPPHKLNPLADLQPVIDTLRRAKADDARAVYEEKKLRLEFERQNSRRIRNLQDKSVRRMNDTKLAIQNHKVKLLEEMENNVRAHIEHETISDIREAVYDQQAEIADEYKCEIKDQTRKRLIEELEPVLKSQLAAQFENEVKNQVISELKEELRTQLESTLRGEIEAELKEGLKAELEAKLRGKIEAELKENLKPELEATLRADIEAKVRAQYGLHQSNDHLPAPTTHQNNTAQLEFDAENYEQCDFNRLDYQHLTPNHRQDNTVQAKIEAESCSQKGSIKPDDYLYTLETQQEHTIQTSPESENRTHPGYSRPGKRQFSHEISEDDSLSSKRIKESPSDDRGLDFSEVQDGQIDREQPLNDQDLALLSTYNEEHPTNHAVKDERPDMGFTRVGGFWGQSDFYGDDSQAEAETDEEGFSSDDDSDEEEEEEEEEDEDEDEDEDDDEVEGQEEGNGASGVIKWTNTQEDALVIDSDEEEEEEDAEEGLDEDQTLVEEEGFVSINGKDLHSSGPIYDDGLTGY
ncbi:hypothetical protein N7G274_006010 [Stereocaulon virgatum]|uniref:Uncharacterized protein n=1 Tax=Stereocaulon virgatum TaxID=373712 RepID=A0ABR4A6Q5_9LECA